MVINKYKLGTLDINKVFKEDLKEQLILVGKRDNLSYKKQQERIFLIDKL